MVLLPDTDKIVLSQVVEGNPVATIVIDAEHKVTHWNRACALMTGVPADEIIGSSEQWRAFYAEPRPIMADLIIDGAIEAKVDQFYHGKYRRSELIDGAFEAEDYFPAFGQGGSWLFFTAAAIRNVQGEVIGAIETLQDVTARRRAEEALRLSEERYRQLSLTDSLTGLYNSRYMHQRLNSELERAHRYQRPVSLLVLDCDNFKSINDRFGHLDGDKVLQCLASVILRCLRNSDSAFRYGGEEFVVLLPETTGKAAHRFAERLCLEFANEIVESATGLSICCTVSVGVAESFAGESENSFIRRADEACYEAKRCGKNRVCFAGAPI